MGEPVLPRGGMGLIGASACTVDRWHSWLQCFMSSSVCAFSWCPHTDAELGLGKETIANQTHTESSKRTCMFPVNSWDSHTENMPGTPSWKSKWRRAKSFQARPSRSKKTTTILQGENRLSSHPTNYRAGYLYTRG